MHRPARRPRDLLVYAHIGDLHLTTDDQDNYRHLDGIISEMVGHETIEIATAARLETARQADGSDAASIGDWETRGILGTQPGPNRNGRHW